MAKKTVTEKVISDYFRKRDQFDSKRYISRKSFETDLRRAVERNRYLFITGESGSGKTWLVQYYFSNNKTKTNYINLSEVAMAGGLMNYLKSTKPIKKTEEEITTDKLISTVNRVYENRDTYISAMKKSSQADSIGIIIDLIGKAAK